MFLGKKTKVWSTPNPWYKRRLRPGDQLSLDWTPQPSPLFGRAIPEPQLELLLDLEPEEVRWRRLSLFLAGIVLQGLLATVVLLAPDIFRRGAEMMGIAVQTKPKEEYTLLIPPDLLKKLNQPPPETNNLSDKNRRAQGKSPTVNPKGLRMPYSRGNTPLPELQGGKKPQPPAPPPSPPPSPAPGASASASPLPPAPKKDDQEARLHLEEVKPPGGNSGQRLDLGTTADAIQQSLQAAMRDRGSGAIGGYGDSPSQLNNLNPNFSTEGPIILSDTKGVDFGPYLARVVYAVRRNWYAVIPEAARLGQKGRVAIVFEILRDGSVPQLRLVGSSGLEPLDRAALSGIRASIPFPPLPPEFTGEHLVLQFNFLYNIGYAP